MISGSSSLYAVPDLQRSLEGPAQLAKGTGRETEPGLSCAAGENTEMGLWRLLLSRKLLANGGQILNTWANNLKQSGFWEACRHHLVLQSERYRWERAQLVSAGIDLTRHFNRETWHWIEIHAFYMPCFISRLGLSSFYQICAFKLRLFDVMLRLTAQAGAWRHVKQRFTNCNFLGQLGFPFFLSKYNMAILTLPISKYIVYISTKSVYYRNVSFSRKKKITF